MDENLEHQHSADAGIGPPPGPALLAPGEEGSRHGVKGGVGMYAEAAALEQQIQENTQVARRVAALGPLEERQPGLDEVSLVFA